MLAKSDGREAEEQRWAKEMWFRRSGELLAELSAERTKSAAATGAAAAAKAEASVAHSELKAAKAEAALISQKCDSLELMLAEAQQSAAERAVAAPIMAADRSDPELPSRMQLEAW